MREDSYHPSNHFLCRTNTSHANGFVKASAGCFDVSILRNSNELSSLVVCSTQWNCTNCGGTGGLSTYEKTLKRRASVTAPHQKCALVDMTGSRSSGHTARLSFLAGLKTITVTFPFLEERAAFLQVRHKRGLPSCFGSCLDACVQRPQRLRRESFVCQRAERIQLPTFKASFVVPF